MGLLPSKTPVSFRGIETAARAEGISRVLERNPVQNLKHLSLLLLKVTCFFVVVFKSRDPGTATVSRNESLHSRSIPDHLFSFISRCELDGAKLLRSSLRFIWHKRSLGLFSLRSCFFQARPRYHEDERGTAEQQAKQRERS